MMLVLFVKVVPTEKNSKSTFQKWIDCLMPFSLSNSQEHLQILDFWIIARSKSSEIINFGESAKKAELRKARAEMKHAFPMDSRTAIFAVIVRKTR
jgi:hypothetical protein